MRLAARTDDNHKDIVKLFRQLGWSVLDLSKVGNGCPDLAVGKFGHSYLCEIKDGKKSQSRRKLTPAQEEFHSEWRGSLIIVENEVDVIEFNRKRSR